MGMEWDLLTKLKADSTLDTLLGVSGDDSKIYPIVAPQGAATPYILYKIAGTGSPDEILDDTRIELRAISESFKTAGDIKDQLIALLDKEDAVDVSSDNYYIYAGKLTGESDLFESTTKRYERLAFFNFKFLKK